MCPALWLGIMSGMQRGRSLKVAVTALALVLPLTACADSSTSRAAVSDPAVRLLSAVRDGDGAAACAVLAPGTIAELEQAAGTPCPDAVVDEDLPEPGTVTQVDVYGQWARVVLTGDTVFLAKFPGRWRVVAAGCQPQRQRPYDCVLHGG